MILLFKDLLKNIVIMPSLTLQEILEYSPFKTTIFVETGTYDGGTIDNVIHSYKNINSIELSKEFVEKAKNKYKHNSNVHIYQGDSAIILPSLCKMLDEPAFFWLDGHWSGGNTAKGDKDCPLIEELNAIICNFTKECVIAIDDVRLFNTNIDHDWLNITRENVLQIVQDRLISYNFYPSTIHPEDRMVLVLKAI